MPPGFVPSLAFADMCSRGNSWFSNDWEHQKWRLV